MNLNKLKPAVVKSGASLKSFRTQTELSDYQGPTSIYNDEYIILDKKKVP
jgi:hypothetical protein